MGKRRTLQIVSENGEAAVIQQMSVIKAATGLILSFLTAGALVAKVAWHLALPALDQRIAEADVPIRAEVQRHLADHERLASKADIESTRREVLRAIERLESQIDAVVDRQVARPGR